MFRLSIFVSACLLLLACLFATGSSIAAVDNRAYGPQDLSQLSVSDQVRVIENEYREQSSGRSIPDDQLDFYLDQIRDSRWSFSQIQNDIAQSLRGSDGYSNNNNNGNNNGGSYNNDDNQYNGGNGGWRRPGGQAWNQREVICTSLNHQYRECRSPFRGPARLSQQMSSTRCAEGRNWGSRPGLIWVDQGCRGRFIEDRNTWPQWGGNSGQQQILCESKSSRYQQCNAGFRGPARLTRQLSQSACIEGRSWGQAQGMIWVSRGCRAWFEDSGWNNGGGSPGNNGGGYPGNSDYSITCSSTNSDYRTCAWDDRYGRPRVIEQLSSQRCVEGQNWGYRDGNVWVNNGCRARFGTSSNNNY